MRFNTFLVSVSVLAAGLSASPVGAEFRRGYIHIVGSGAVVPFASAVGETLAKSKKFPMPRIESTSTGGGVKLFCEGVGGDFPDIVSTSRPLKKKELEECRKGGVDEIIEIKIGYDGLLLAQSKKAPPLDLTRDEVRRALWKWVPDKSGNLTANPNTNWKQVNPAFPDMPIEVLGPGVTSGSHDAFVDMISELKCNTRPWVAEGKTEPTPEMLKKCRTVREDGVFVGGREHDEAVIQQVLTSSSKLAIIDYRALEENRKHLRAVPIDGVEPDQDSIASKRYAGSRPLFLYVKKANVGRTPGLKEYLAEFTSEKAWGTKGYLEKKGLLPAQADERKVYAADAKDLKSMSLPK